MDVLVNVIRKTCTKCGEEKTLDEFPPRPLAKDRKGSWCHKCQLMWRKTKRAANPEWARAEGRKNYKKYGTKSRAAWRRWGKKRRCADHGITVEQYDEVEKSQGGKCRICRGDPIIKNGGRPARLAIDHDPATGKFRGLLCSPCNLALGFIDRVGLENVRDYLTAA